MIRLLDLHSKGMTDRARQPAQSIQQLHTLSQSGAAIDVLLLELLHVQCKSSNVRMRWLRVSAPVHHPGRLVVSMIVMYTLMQFYVSQWQTGELLALSVSMQCSSEFLQTI